jgi:hypothetical protein
VAIDSSTDLPLETCLEALSHNESWLPAFDETETVSDKSRGRVLDRAVKKLAVREFEWKGAPKLEKRIIHHRSSAI